MNHTIFLFISDLHHWKPEELIKIKAMRESGAYDVCVLLGDIPELALKLIKTHNAETPLFGVAGNHDDWNTLAECGIADIHGKAITVNGITVAGFGGSNRYKNGDYAMLTQKESIAASRAIPKADFLVSHDTMYKAFAEKDPAHIGLKGISKYVKRAGIKLNICGHYHTQTARRRNGCTVHCVYRFAVMRVRNDCVNDYIFENIEFLPRE